METQIIPIALTPRICSTLTPSFRSASKRHRFTALALPCALLLFSGALIPAQQPVQQPTQQPLSLQDAALQGQFIFEQSAVTGMVLVVVRDREVMIKGYGETFPGSGHSPDSTSLVRLCSVSKILTTDLLQKLVADGKVALTDPLQRYAPPGKQVPIQTDAADGTQISLRDLATHTSGLPREVAAYPKKIPHFTFPDYAFRWDWLPEQTLLFPPGTTAVYSNVGFDLLGDALAAASGKSYATLLHDRLLQPLRMWDTTLFPSAEQCARLLLGAGDEGPCTSTAESGASGGVYSTPADMARLIQYLLHIPDASPLPAPQLAVYLLPAQLRSIQGLSHAGNPTGIGLGWIQLGDPNTPSVLLEKTGGGAGFTTYIALSPSRHTGIFLAVTEGKGKQQIDFYHEANNLLAALAGVPPLPPRMRRAPSPRKLPKRTPRAPSRAKSRT